MTEMYRFLGLLLKINHVHRSVEGCKFVWYPIMNGKVNAQDVWYADSRQALEMDYNWELTGAQMLSARRIWLVAAILIVKLLHILILPLK